jgi:hypothetical protein
MLGDLRATTGVSQVQTKRKLRVIITDFFEDEETDLTEILSQLDPSEKNEVDIVTAVTSDTKERVPVPEVIKMQEFKFNSYCSGVHFEAPERCFNYDSDYFDPIAYFADDIDYKWIESYNARHMFLRISPRDLELVFQKCEELVKDSLTEVPTLSTVMMLLGPDAPPYPVCKAIFRHWEEREKQNGSVIRYLEFPPDHCQLRQGAVSNFRQLNKTRKGMKGPDYIKNLFQQLETMNAMKKEAIELLAAQEKKRQDDERFVREKMRMLKDRIGEGMSGLALETPIIRRQPSEVAEGRESGLVPNPPSGPSFLQWCMRRCL